MRDSVLELAFEFHTFHRDYCNRYAAVIYRDGSGTSSHTNEIYQWNESREALEEYLEGVTCAGGRADWVGPLDMALHQMNWRNGYNWIFWVARANAFGRVFSGNAGDSQDRAEALERLVREMATRHIRFAGVNVKQGTDSGCERTLKEMQRIYREAGGPSFTVKEMEDDNQCIWDEEDIL
jgi:hypothetical protein